MDLLRYSLLVSVFVWCLCCSVAQVGLIGTAKSAFSPCENGAVFMEHDSGRPPSLENYWDGSIDLERAGQKYVENRVEMTLTAPASIIVDEEDAYVYFGNNGFYISYYHLPNRTELKFRVQGKKDKPFPDIVSLLLNGADICPNPKQWRKTFGGSGGVADSSNQNRFDQDSCGRQIVKHTALVMNGFPSEAGEWPWHVALYYREANNRIEYKCGGTLVSNDTILTAAHCVTVGSAPLIPEKILVRLGQHDRLATTQNTQEFQVHRVIVHESFNSNDLNHDIALLRLKTQATFTNYVQPICLWESEPTNLDEVVGKNGIVIGWGLNEKEESSQYLTQARMPVVDFGDCLLSDRDVFGTLLSSTNFCAGFRNGTSVCNGDSGGGMFFKRDNRFFIRGLVSVSTTQENRDICNPKQYVVFTDVAKYVSWIRRNISNR